MQYSATLTGNEFLLFEFKVVVELLAKGLDEKTIRDLVVKQNLFKYISSSSIKKRLGAILKRSKSLDQEFITYLAKNNDDSLYRFACLSSIIKTDKLFSEFISLIFLDKYGHANKLNQSDIDDFFINRIEQSKTVSSWTTQTIAKLKSAFTRILANAHLIHSPDDLIYKYPYISSTVVSSTAIYLDSLSLNILDRSMKIFT